MDDSKYFFHFGGEVLNKWLKAWSIFIFTIGGLLVVLLIGLI
ncbi:hypothetical protein Bsph_1287 [Lysinibacillus sphaericus C3-41]|uniref:Uncharacterized protein n=1 Tax=Lysinibacillus sphaericus (strain C3-41) TaxID=444177 RepID=B1HP43_LYSSC|nr:hypothetical protein Bsph_1287 [Lysinibacillus sphaericus C3-41]